MQSRVEALEETKSKIKQVELKLAGANTQRIRLMLSPEGQPIVELRLELHAVMLEAYVAMHEGEEQFEAGNMSESYYRELVSEYEEALGSSTQQEGVEHAMFAETDAEIEALDIELQSLRSLKFLLDHFLVIGMQS